MKKCPSVFRIATAIGAVAFCTVASAQDSSTTNATAATAPPVATAPPAAPAAPSLPYGVGEVVKMYQGGINKEVIVNYINNTALPYHLSADGIIYLQTLGMPQEITKAMILRDGQLLQQQQANQQFYQQPQQPMPAPAPGQYGPGPGQTPPPQEVVAPTTPAPAVTVVGADVPAVYGYGYPYYGWPYYYGGPVVYGGWGWGWGGYRGGFRGGGGFHGGGHR